MQCCLSHSACFGFHCSWTYLWLTCVKDCETIQSVRANWQASGFGLIKLSVYSCPLCKRQVPGKIRKLRWHLRVVHSLSDSQDYTIICSQNGCQRTYHNLNSYSRHLSREHSSGHTCASNDQALVHYKSAISEETDVIPLMIWKPQILWDQKQRFIKWGLYISL